MLSDSEKLECFRKEINYIQDPNVKRWVCKALLVIPEYFYHIPASSTGKYHPNYTLGEGGLVRHTKAAVKFAMSLFELEMYNAFKPIEKDLMIAALILHDSYKCGIEKEQYTRYDHPVIAANEVSKIPGLDKEQMSLLTNCIRKHMGQWNTDNKGNIFAEKPSSKYEKFVHQCDYLASRKWAEVDVEMPLR